MDYVLQIINTLYLEITGFYNSGAFLAIKILLGIYAAVLFADIVLLLIQRGGFSGDFRETLTGMNIPQELTNRKKAMRKKWSKIRQCLESGQDAQYKIAIIEGDKIIDELIAGLGYKGGNMMERLGSIPDTQVANIEGMKQAHEIRNRIINDESFVLSKDEAENIIRQYEELLKQFEVLD